MSRSIVTSKACGVQRCWAARLTALGCSKFFQIAKVAQSFSSNKANFCTADPPLKCSKARLENFCLPDLR